MNSLKKKIFEGFFKKVNSKGFVITVIVSILFVAGITIGSNFEKKEISVKKEKIENRKNKSIEINDGLPNTNKTDNSDSVKKNDSEKTDVTNSEEGYKDGEYIGKSKGYNGDIKVKVKIKNGKISSIDILENSDDKEYFDSAKSIIDEIIKAQNTHVEAVSGATYSSNGILDAVQEALDSGV